MVWISRRHGLVALSGLLWLAGHGLAEEPQAPESPATNIAIIGAGAAGSSAAYHLRRFADQGGLPVNVTIFEKTSRIGGRALTVNALDDPLEPVELGAAVFIEANSILYSAAGEFGLGLSDTSDIDGAIAIWDGETIRYRQESGPWKWWSYAKLFWKYGMAPYKTQNLVQEIVGKFLEMYKAPHFPFRSLNQKAEELGLTKLTGLTGGQYLEERGIDGQFAQDIIQAATRANYATNLAHIHGLETIVSLAPEGAVQVTGGNWQIFSNMVKSSSAAFHPDTTVTSIKTHKNEDADATTEKYTIATQKTGSEDEDEAYPTAFDKVIVAGPWQYGGIEAPADLIQPAIDEIPYVRLHVTLFTSPSKLSPAYFNLPADQEAPTTVLTTLHPENEAAPGSGAAGKSGFFTVSIQRAVTNPRTSGTEYLYKIFSPMPVDAALLTKLLGVEVPETFTGKAGEGDVEPISWYYPAVFNSYPIELPRVTFQDPVLRDGLYYTSGIESFISTMETSALMGKNVAKLIADELAGRDSKVEGEKEGADADAPAEEPPTGLGDEL